MNNSNTAHGIGPARFTAGPTTGAPVVSTSIGHSTRGTSVPSQQAYGASQRAMPRPAQLETRRTNCPRVWRKYLQRGQPRPNNTSSPSAGTNDRGKLSSSAGHHGAGTCDADSDANREPWPHRLIAVVAHDGVDLLMIESRGDIPDRRDRGVILDCVREHDDIELSYVWRDKSEPLLWYADALAGSMREELFVRRRVTKTQDQLGLRDADVEWLRPNPVHA